MTRLKAGVLLSVVWVVVCLAVSAALYFGADLSRSLSGFGGIVVASAVLGGFEGLGSRKN